MSRRRTSLSPTLFPFLAVLVCTLGTLILLLALVAVDAEKSAQAAVQEQAEAAVLATEEEVWEAERLIAFRDSQTAQLQRKHGELAHLEDHIRRLRDQLHTLRTEIEAAHGEPRNEKQTGQTQKLLAELQEKIENETKRLEMLREDNDGRPPRVVIVPYQGTNGTNRRPIYVECTDSAIVIQPEGVRITAANLEGPIGPGNPLDAALRAVRTHWQKVDANSPPPYPLLLVRPDGVHAYAAARIAMETWDDQFGYELIPKDLELAFPKADENLKVQIAQAIDDAVLRNQAKVAASLGRRNGFTGPQRGIPGSVVANGTMAGGLAKNSPNRRRGDAWGPKDSDTLGDANPGSNEPNTFGSSRLGEGNGVSTGTLAPPRTGSIGAGGLAIADDWDAPGFARENPGKDSMRSQSPDGFLAGPAQDPQSFAANGSSSGDQTEPGSKLPDAESASSIPGDDAPPDAQFGSNGREFGAADRQPFPSPPMSSPDSPPSEMIGGTGNEEPVGFGGSQGLAGGLAPTGQASAGQASAGDPSHAGASSASDLSTDGTSVSMDAAGAPSPGLSGPSNSPPPDPHAKTFSEAMTQRQANPSPRAPKVRPNGMPPSLSSGNNWALPGSVVGQRGATIVRHLDAICQADGFILLAEGNRGGQPQAFLVEEEQTEEAVFELGTAIGQRVTAWGPAMLNGRWAPVLRVRVARGAEARFQQLESLMRNSGVRVERIQEVPR